MGRLPDQQPPQSSDQPSSPSPPPPPQGYPNHHNNPLSPPPQEDLYMTENDHSTTPRSYIPENMPPPETYPPQKSTTYPPQQPEAYPPQQPDPVNFPPQQQPDPVSFPPQQQPVNYPPPQQQAPSTPPPQNYNYVYANNGQPQQGGNYVHDNNGQPGYQTPNMNPQNGVSIGNQYIVQTQGWKTGLFDCADDMENAFITACFPCITFGQIAEILDNGQTSCATSGLLYAVLAPLIGIPCIMSCSYRTKMRSRFGLMETPAPDWVKHCFCEWCALCQIYRELKNHGLDPAIGWQANMVRNQQRQQYSMMAPPMNQRMM